MTATLTNVEQRVLGVLIEKSLTQPGGYPMTVNAVTLGANQKQNRDPVVEYGEGEVSAALRKLEHRHLVSQSPPAMGARAVRFQHRAVEVYHWDRREQAIMAELMLRGRQTPGEFRTHASRMTPFADLESVLATLAALRAYNPPFVEELPREPGRSANRFGHLLSAEDASSDPVPIVSPCETPAQPAPQALALADRVARLEVEVAQLREAIAAMKNANRSLLDAGPPDAV